MLEQVENGEKCPFEALVEINGQIEMLEALKAKVLAIALNNFDKETDTGKKNFKKYGYEFSLTQGGKYYYNHSHSWAELQEKQKRIEGFMQTAYKQKLPSFVDTETGEVFESALYVPSKQSIAIKKSK